MATNKDRLIGRLETIMSMTDTEGVKQLADVLLEILETDVTVISGFKGKGDDGNE